MPPVTSSTVALLTPDAHGVLRIGQTRVTLASVVTAFKNGASPETIASNFPSLALADVYEVIAHYLRHRESLDDTLAQEDAALEEFVAPFKASDEANNVTFRKRLLERSQRR